MWELVQELSIVQWALIIGGVILIYPLIFKADEPNPVPVTPKPSPKPQPKPVPAPDLIGLDAELVSIVETWAVLRSACKKANLNEAETKLLEVFPLLVQEAKPK
jgi:hypothetical protein|tara:strand:- start:712 stop:1023 length:312 start_codon:yes stop_codon:yes gene_type:complete